MFENFELKEYQTNSLNLFERYLETLTTARFNYLEQQEKLAKAGVKAVLDDWTKQAFEKVCAFAQFTARKDATGESIPAVCYKVPTGGGKTLMATLSVIKIFHHYIHQQYGFVLWIVPNEAIYSQTLKTLRDNDHPYRNFLNAAFRGKIRILTKDDRITRQMVDENLCIMVMMLQSSNRETKESLKVFKARGDYHGFFPLESDYEANKLLLEKIPNLDIHGSNFIAIIKNSLGNMLRMIRPVIVMDEQHKATSIKATETLQTFNPRFILELSATPKDYKFQDGTTQSPNELVKISGSQLLREGMIKIPINVRVTADEKWQDVLRQSLDKLDDLQKKSKQHFADTNRIIRPIMLVQVERTGKDQRDGKFIHADDAKEQLLKLGLKEHEIKIKSADNNELENIDLLASNCPVRAIITKSALQEGWDCPFVYILVSLSSSKSLTAITQLLGRVLRQPDATKSKVEELNQSYVFCLHKETNDLIKKIKSSLENEGLGDIAYQINVVDGSADLLEYITINRRDKFKDTKIVLPNVIWTGDKEPRGIEYQSDILPYINWLEFDMQEIEGLIVPFNSQVQNYEISFGNDLFKNDIIDYSLRQEELKKQFIVADAVRAINDIVLNPWVGYELVSRLESALLKKWTREQIDLQYFNIIKQFRSLLIRKSDEEAEKNFSEGLKNGKITIHFRSDDLPDWSMPDTIKSKKDGKPIWRRDAKPVQNSLFDPILDDGFNSAEKGVAIMLDEHEKVHWWFRNCVEDRHYHFQGWRKERVYPDFIFFLNSARNEICVWEGKGDQLAGNQDTEYKKKLMEMVSDNFSFEKVPSQGKLDIDTAQGNKISCKMVLYSDFEQALNKEALRA